MNNEINSSLLKLDNNDKNTNIDDSCFYKKFAKKEKKNKIDQFVKFKPKNISKKNGEHSLEGAENKVKSILSSFLRTMRNEEKKDEFNIKSPCIRNHRSKLPPKKVNTNKEKRDKRQIKNLFNPEDNNKLTILNKFCMNNDKNKENENSSHKVTSDDINASIINKNKKYLDIKTNLSSSKINYNNSQSSEDNEKFKSDIFSNISKNTINHNHRVNRKSKFISNLSINNFHSMDKSDNGSKVNDNVISSSFVNGKEKNHFEKKKNFLKNSSAKTLSIYQKKFFFGENPVDLINKKKASNITDPCVSSKNKISDIQKNNIIKKKSFISKKHDNKYNNTFLIKTTKSNEIINRNKLFDKKYIAKNGFISIKRFSSDYNISNQISNKLAIKVENHKRKTMQYTKKYLLNNDPKNKLHKVENVLKNLQEKLKNSLIIGPEDLDLELNDFSQKKKTKKNREKRISRKEALSSKINLINIKSSQNLAGNKDFLINKTKSNLYDESGKTKLQLPNNDLFNNTNNVSKNETELETLKTGEQECTNTPLPYIRNNSQISITMEKYRVLTHKIMIYDSLDDEEIEDEVYEFYYINPESKFSIAFDGILLFITIYSMFDFPYYLAHSLTFCKKSIFSFERIFNIFTEIIYFFDLIFGFFRAYYNFEEILIKKHSSIVKKYLKSWFIFDLVGAIPFYSIIKIKEQKCIYSFSAIYYNYKLNNINYLFLCNRMIKMIKSITYNQAYNFITNILNDNKYYNQISLFLNICFILLIFHLSSCIYIFIGRNSYPNWIMTTNLDNKSFYHIYICGIYILITALTTVGYGDITCYSFKERIFQLILLIIGIVVYSWIVSSLSNYIKKINEQSADLESRISILDQIKRSNPNMTRDLYDRILRHLKYKKYFEKKDKSLIFDSLPVTLKNNLIAEMYKPIIKNSIFFTSFQNTDFLVRVILSFKPILALKKDILVNEGDIVEDIMFVKKGVLSLELPLNMENPEENIKHYLNMPILQAENNINLDKVGDNSLMREKSIRLGAYNTLNKTNGDNNLNMKNISYVRILSIRENEHFGDVLMFLEQRSPLRVKVRTKKAELFFLKKIEAVKISSSYQNIWKRINKKSVFNFEQIKKSIIKIVEIYSSYKKIEHEVKEKGKIKKRRKSRYSFNFEVDKNIFEPLKELNNKKFFSQKDLIVKNKYSEMFYDDNKSEVSSQHKYQSSQTLNLTNSFYTNKSLNSDSLIDSDNSFKTNKKNKKKNKMNKMSLFQNNFKKSEISSQINSENFSIKNISSQESDIRDFHLIESNKKVLPEDENVITNQKHKNENIGTLSQQINIKKNYLKEDDIDNNNDVDLNSKKDSKKNEKLKSLSKSSNSYKKSNSKSLSSSSLESSINFSANLPKKILKNKYIGSLSDKSSEKSKNSYFIGSKINEEIYSDEECDIPIKEEMLLSKKIKLSKIENKSKINNFYENKNNFENSKVRILLDYSATLSNTNVFEKDKEKNEKQKRSDINIDKKNVDSCPNLNECKKEKEEKKIFEVNKKITLSVGKEISIEIPSLYENIYQLSNYKYYKDKNLQNKVKNILQKEPQSHNHSSISSTGLNMNLLQSNSRINNRSTLKSRKTITSTNSQNKLRNKSLLLNHSLNNNGVINKRRTIEKRHSVFIKKGNIKDMLGPEFHHSPTFKNKDISQISMNKINNNLNMKLGIKRKSTHAGFFGKKLNNNINTEINETTLIKNEEPNHRKKRSSLINTINFNIKKTNQNLNNPQEFYSNYFQLLLDIRNKNKGNNDNKRLLLSCKKIHTSKNKNKKEKNKGFKKGFTMWVDT